MTQLEKLNDNACRQCVFLWFVSIDNNQAKIMIQLRDDGLLGTSGGKIEKNETVIEALFREVKEEIVYDINEYPDQLITPLLVIVDKSTNWAINSFYRVVSSQEMEKLRFSYRNSSHTHEVAGIAIYDVKPKTIRNIKKQKFSGTALEEFSALVSIVTSGNL
jgi:8-oxo-dGTP pyrophosphatase MutT (NUDIX family)